MVKLIFKKPKIRFGENFEKGYYFKGEFLSRYKTEAIRILRERVEGLSIEERDKTDEWKIIHQEYLKSIERTKKINKTKQPYYKKQRERIIKRKIILLKEKINYLEWMKKEKMKEFDERIILIKNEITKLEKW